jgi:hypothetical protein
MNVTIEDVDGKPKKCVRDVYLEGGEYTRTNSAASKNCHVCWRVTLSTGKCYTLDLTSAQFGHHQTLTPWSEYLRTLEFKDIAFNPGGSTCETIASTDFYGFGFPTLMSDYICAKIKSSKLGRSEMLKWLSDNVDKLMDAVMDMGCNEHGLVRHESGRVLRK